MDIIKTDGTTEPFSPSKLCLSIRKSGAPREVADAACKTVESKVSPNDSTNSIYRKALKYLVKESPDVAARYSLHHALEMLGPAGFIFEQYFETVLQAYGFTTKRDVILQGSCVTHEIDVIAEVGSKRFLVEAKYHNVPGLKTHVDVIMYADARLVDIVKNEPDKNKSKFEYGMWVVTNTKFTDAAIQYAKCRGIRLTGWNHPRGESMEDIIAALQRDGSDFAQATLKTLNEKSPRGMVVALKLLRLARRSNSLEECLVREYRAALAVFASDDFREGVRAAVIDKDRNPKWSPPRIEDVTAEMVMPYFAEIGADELKFP